MTTDSAFERRLSEMEITPEMAKDCALRLIAGAFHRTDNKPRFSIPTRHDDDDALILEFIERAARQASDDYRQGLEDAAKDVLAERERQKVVEGWTQEHDDRHSDRELARAAAVYALHAAQPPNIIFSSELQEEIPENWPWSSCYFKPRGPRRDLVRAGALILAEIERIDRAAIRALGETK